MIRYANNDIDVAMRIREFVIMDCVSVSLNLRFLINCGTAHTTYMILAIDNRKSLVIMLLDTPFLLYGYMPC